jgi:hypothetical protein
MKRIILSFLILGSILLIPAYAGAVVIDPTPDNISGVGASWEYRDYGNYGLLASIGGSQQRSGAYYTLEASVVTGGFLNTIEDVFRVQAKHIETQKLYNLQYDPYTYLGTPYDAWALKVPPSDWMFEGNWKFILVYNGSDGEIHRQRLTIPAERPAFAAKVSHVALNRSPDPPPSFVVSWSGIGDPYISPITYRVMIFEAGTAHIVESIRGDWEGGSGTYDAALNKVTFTIPSMYGGEAYVCRLENRVKWVGRSVYYMILPAFSP